MGHKIKGGKDVESRYVIPPAPEQLKLYQEGYKNLDILGMRMEERLKAIEDVMASIPEEQRELMKKHGIRMMRKNTLESGNER